MNISQALDQTADSLKKTNWKKFTKEAIDLWVAFFKVIVTLAVLTYLACKAGMWMINRLNDWLSARWLRMLGLNIPIMEEAENEEDEVPLPAPLVADPWHTPIEVELMLPQALEPMAVFFTTPQLMLVAAQAPVALLAPVLQEQTPPSPRKRRRKSAPESPPAVVVTEATPTPARRTRGRRAHQEERKKARQAA